MSPNVVDSMVALLFSKDRALQLQAAIESFFLHCLDPGRIKLVVLYRTSSCLHARQYDRLKARFEDVSFVQEVDFKEQVLAAIGRFGYVLFLVDDNLFVGDFSIGEVIEALRSSPRAIGFSLRLGRNTVYCYTRDARQSLPVFEQAGPRILKYDWTVAEYDFGYPLEVSSSVYRAAEILPLLRKLEFSNPNTLEAAMAANSHFYRDLRDELLCFESSVAFCAPLNVVQTTWNNRAGADENYSVDGLARIFEAGARVDVGKYCGFVPDSCHQEVELYFDGFVDSGCRAADREEFEPAFSIVMANYNNAPYVSQAIESVLRQTFSRWELIIVDDCSTDGSLEVIERYLRDRRIRLVRHETNRGYTAALETGIANVRSEYFGILDSDDCLLPQAVDRMYNEHKSHPDCGLIYSQFVLCDAHLNRKGIGFCRAIPPGGSTLDAPVVSHFKTFKLRDYLKTDGYDQNILYAEDVDIVYKMEEVAPLRFVDECLYLYREVPDSISRSREKVNIAIMSRVKARINALKRRCHAQARRTGCSFATLFRRALEEARLKHEDLEQYLVILSKLYENRMLDGVNWPSAADRWSTEDAVIWLAANVDVQFDKLFELIRRHRVSRSLPLVTVEMVAYNSESFIKQAIDSVLAQTYKNFELVLVDDGSTDGTAEIITSYSDPRIRYIRTPHRNCASARNRVIAEARGEYLLCVDSDDFIEPEYLEKMVAYAVEHPQIDYFYPGSLTLVDAAGNCTAQRWSYPDFSDPTTLPAFLFGKAYGPIPNAGSLKSRAMYRRIGGYDDVDSVEDFVFLCKNALKITFLRVEDNPTYFYRRRPGSSSQNFEVRNRIMASALNDMVSAYPPGVLCPQIAGIKDEHTRRRRYYEYLMRTFYRHAEGASGNCGRHFRAYGDYYRQKLF